MLMSPIANQEQQEIIFVYLQTRIIVGDRCKDRS